LLAQQQQMQALLAQQQLAAAVPVPKTSQCSDLLLLIHSKINICPSCKPMRADDQQRGSRNSLRMVFSVFGLQG
jgi:hypothetical protein